MYTKFETNTVIAVFGAIITYLFGGMDVLLEVFGMVLIIDTITGMVKYHSQGQYESKKFRQGLWKKSGYMLAIIFAVQLDRLMGDNGMLRGAILYCVIANEGASILENLGEMGVPIPNAISRGISVLKDRADISNDNIEK